MNPREHILLGAAFTFTIWTLSPNLSIIYLLLIFLSSFLIGFDHKLSSFIRPKKKEFYILHTIEFNFLLGLSGFFFIYTFYLFIGMVFHLLVDVISLLQEGNLNKREYFFFNLLRKQI